MTYNSLVSKFLSCFLVTGFLLAPFGTLIARQVEASSLQTLEICFVSLDVDGQVKQSLPADTSISINLFENVLLLENQVNTLTGSFQTALYTTQSANRDVLNNDGSYDAYCQAFQYSYPAGHEFAYTQAQLLSSNPNIVVNGYNDQFNIQVQTPTDVLPYSGEFFDDVIGNEADRNINSDGHIIMSTDREYRHLIVVVQDNTPIVATTPPQISIDLNSGAANTDNPQVNVGLNADSEGPLQYIRFAASPEQITAQNWTEYSSFTGTAMLPLSHEPGSKNLCVQVQNSIGQLSNIACDTIELVTLDPEEPPVQPEPVNPYPASGFIKINADAVYTNSSAVNLNLTTTGNPIYVRLVQTEGNAVAPTPQDVTNPSQDQNGWTYWQSFSEIAQWDLGGSFGVKTVYAQYMFADNTVSSVNSDSILYGPYYAVNYSPISHSELGDGVTTGISGSSYEQILPEYTLDNLPTSIEAGQKFIIKLVAANNGTYTWLPGQVNVTYFWNDQRGGNAPLASTVAYSSSTGVLQMEVTAPTVSGTYTLKIDTVDEGIAQFSQFNNPALSYQVDVFPSLVTASPALPVPHTDSHTGHYPTNPQAGQVHTITGYVRIATPNNFGAPYMIVETDGSGAVWYIVQHDIGQYLNQVITAPIQFTSTGSYNFNLIGWDGIPVSSPGGTITLRPGDTYEVEVRYQNTGYHFWQPTNPGGAGAPNGGTRLGLQRVTPSDFYDSTTWIDGFRVRMANTQPVKYGDVARFRFTLRAPNGISAGTYRECFRPVIEAITWISDESKEICINVQITNSVTPPVNNLPPLPPEPTGDNGYILRFAGSDLLSGPNTGFPSVVSVSYGDAVTVIGEATVGNGHWVKVRTSGNQEGWIPAGSVDYVNNPPDISFALNNTYIPNYVCAGTLTVRNGPGGQYAVVQVMPWGSNTYILTTFNGWSLVSLPNGQTGWTQAGQLCSGHYAPSYGGIYAASSGNIAGQTYYNGQVFSRPLTQGSYTISQGYHDGHYATDYAAACGTPMFSVADGVVSRTQTGFGNTYTTEPLSPLQQVIRMNSVNLVEINHDNGSQGVYLHLQDVSVSPGQRVARGQQIGTVGNSGWSTGCHLHLMLNATQDVYGPKLDPEGVFNQPVPVNLLPAANAIRARELSAGYARAAAPNGQLHLYCGAYIQDYNYFLDPGQSWQTYTNLIYNPAVGAALRLRGDIRIAYWDKYQGTCGSLGLPTSDDLWAATSTQGTSGAYQQFDNGTIHSSYRGTFATTGLLNQIHTSSGGTATHGFPITEMYSTADRGMCQGFENGVLCEVAEQTSGVVDLFTAKQNSYKSYTLNGKLHDYCGTKIQDYSALIPYANSSNMLSLVQSGGSFFTGVFNGYGNSSLILNPTTNQVHLLTGGLAFTYFNNGACNTFGYPTMDPAETAGKDGWWQEFEKDGRKTTIYWSYLDKKAQGSWVSGDIRDYHNTRGGTASGLKFPETHEWSETSVCGTTGSMQHFQTGKVFSSKFGTFHIGYGGWIDYQYALGGIAVTGWPKGIPYVIDGFLNYSLWQFESGAINWKVNQWWNGFSGCTIDDKRPNDPTAIPQVEAIHAREDAFADFVRADGAAGIPHSWACDAWVVDYKQIVLGNGKIYNNAVTVTNGNQAYILSERIKNIYFNEGGCDTFGLPVADALPDYKPAKHPGELDWQPFTKSSIHHSENLQYGSGFLGVPQWTNREVVTTITVSEAHNIYASGLLPETADAAFVDGYLGAPVDPDLGWHSIEVDETTVNLYGYRFQGGYIVQIDGVYVKILNSLGSEALIRDQTGESTGSQSMQAFVDGFIEGVKAIISDVAGNLLQFGVSLLAKLFAGPIGALFRIGEFVVAVGRIIVAYQQNQQGIDYIAQEMTTADKLYLVGNLAGAIVAGVGTGLLLDELGRVGANLLSRMGAAGQTLKSIADAGVDLSSKLRNTLQKMYAAGEASATHADNILALITANPALMGKITGELGELTSEQALKTVQIANKGIAVNVSEMPELLTRLTGEFGSLDAKDVNMLVTYARQGGAIDATAYGAARAISPTTPAVFILRNQVETLPGDYSLLDIKHTFFADFNADGTFRGGGHYYEVMDEYIRHGLVEAARDPLGINRINSLSEITTNPNEIIAIYVKETKGNSTVWQFKTITPQDMSAVEYLEIGKDFLANSTQTVTSPSLYEHIIELNGKIVLMNGRINPNELRTWFFKIN